MDLRKGVLGHLDIVQSYVNNPNLKDGDIVIWVDLLPNRPVVSNKCLLHQSSIIKFVPNQTTVFPDWKPMCQAIFCCQAC